MTTIYSITDTCNTDIYEYFNLDVETDGFNNLPEFDNAIQDNSPEDGAMWVSQSEFKTVYNFFKRYVHSYNEYACEMMISFDQNLDYIYADDAELIIHEFGRIIQQALRKSDVMTQNGRDFFLLLPELTEYDKVSVINRIKRKLQETGFYSLANIRIDSKMIGPTGDYLTCSRMAI